MDYKMEVEKPGPYVVTLDKNTSLGTLHNITCKKNTDTIIATGMAFKDAVQIAELMNGTYCPGEF